MKTRRVTISDIDQALQKLEYAGNSVNHYVFITTDQIDQTVKEYADSIYERTAHVEVVVLDCAIFSTCSIV